MENERESGKENLTFKLEKRAPTDEQETPVPRRAAEQVGGGIPRTRVQPIIPHVKRTDKGMVKEKQDCPITGGGKKLG